MISLDTFRKYRYSDIIKGNIDIKKCDYDEDVYEKPLTDQMLRDRLAFLSLFVTETVDEAIAIQNIFPELSEIFNEMNEYLARPEEVLGMFSEALRILNHNTAVLMVDEYRKKYQEMENNLKKEMKKSQEMQQEMQEMQSNLNKEMQEQQKILDDKDKQINSQEEQHKKDLERIAELEAMLKESRESKESNGQG
jgi:chromosome segregation ATPase